MDGPDFICIGMPKAGTGWLYDQLQYHPGFWMPPVKEIAYLHQARPVLRYVVNRLERVRKKGARATQLARRTEEIERRRPGDERDLRFLRQAARSSGKPMDIYLYRDLFRFKGELLSGDVSPMYCDLAAETIECVARELPHSKIILLVRDPVARAWSRICMAYRGGKFDAVLLDQPDQFRAFFSRSRRMQGKLEPTKITARWQKHAPALPFKVILLDQIARDPEQVRREILTFIGADPGKRGVAADYNRKAADAKLEMPHPIRDILVEYFREELLACAALFGGFAREWPAKYGL